MPNIWVGKEIASLEDNQPIASWKNEKGNFFCKLTETMSKVVSAISNPNYRGHGLIVFLDRKPGLYDKIRITKILGKAAVAEVVEAYR